MNYKIPSYENDDQSDYSYGSDRNNLRKEIVWLYSVKSGERNRMVAYGYTEK